MMETDYSYPSGYPDGEEMNSENLKKIPHLCVLNLQGVYSNLKTAEKKAVDYLLACPEKVMNMTVAEFSEAAGCSEATIVRVSKRIGYEGFPELKRDFIAFSKAENSVEYDNISRGDTPVDILKKVFESSISALNDTLNILQVDSFNQAVSALTRAENIAFSGLGDAGIVAMEAHQRFTRAGKQTLYSPDPDIQLINATQLNPGDVLIAVSHSGRTRPVINTVKTAKDRGATVIAITNFPVSVLTKKADIVLQTAAFARTIHGEVISKRLTALCIIESLYLTYLMAHQETLSPFLNRANEIVKLNKYS